MKDIMEEERNIIFIIPDNYYLKENMLMEKN